MSPRREGRNTLARVSGFEIRADQLKPLDWLGRDRQRFQVAWAKFGSLVAGAQIASQRIWDS